MIGLTTDFMNPIKEFESAMSKKMLLKSVFYKRVFGGKGFEFDSFREYTAGQDDSNAIDWKASMRAGGQLLVRQYLEERDLKVFFIIDTGDNMVFGSGDRLKADSSAEIALSLAHLILMSGDKIGFSLFNENTVSIKPFSPGLNQFYSFTKALSNIKLYGGKSNLASAIEYVKPYLKNTSAIFIISDFLNMDSESLLALKNLGVMYETIGVMVRDRVDMQLSDISGEVIVEDIKTGEQVLINPNLIRYEFERNAYEDFSRTQEFFSKSGIDLVKINSNEDFVIPLVDFLKKRTSGRNSK